MVVPIDKAKGEGIMRKLVFSIVFAFSLLLFQPLVFADDDCNTTKIAVSLDIVPGAIFNKLSKDYGQRSRDEWHGFVEDMFINTLSEYIPEISFFSLSKGGGQKYHYHLRANMTLSGGGEDITVIPEGALTIEGKTYFTPPLFGSEWVGYWIVACLIANSDCIPNRDWVVACELSNAKDLQQSIRNLAGHFQQMDRNIIDHEANHPSAPRDPNLKIYIDKRYISPVDQETRKTEVYGIVQDCRGRQICARFHSQPVYYQDHIDRLDLKCGPRCQPGTHVGEFMVIVTNKSECRSVGDYILIKGVEPDKKKIRFKTCSLGEDSPIEVEKEIVIRGLEVEVRPDRKEICDGEQTNIVITLNETDTEGGKYPVEGKDIGVKITGLKNGTLQAKDGYITNKDGKVVLKYTAGDRDENLKVNAWFDPPKYPDKAKGKATIKIIHSKVYAKITYIKNSTRDFSEIKHYPYDSTKQANMKENIKFTIYLECEEKPRIDYKFDKKSLKMKIRSYTYQIKTARIQSALYEGQSSTHNKLIDYSVRWDYRCKYSKIGTDFQLTPQSSKPIVQIRVDPTTGNMKRVHLPKYAVTGTVSHKTECSGVKRKRVGVDEKLVPYNRKDSRDSDSTISLQRPVDDREECSKVADDKNKKFLRGECSQIRKGKYKTEELTYKWEVVIRGNK